MANPNHPQQITARRTPETSSGGRQVKAQVASTGADNLPGYIPQMNDPDVKGLVTGLSMFNDKLMDRMREEQDKEAEEGALDRNTGQEPKKDSPSYTRAYFSVDALVRGQNDGSQLLQRYATEFDKDTGDLEGWLGETYQANLKGIKDKDYIGAYSRGITEALGAIRKSHNEYQRKAVVDRTESNAMQLLDGGVAAYVNGKMPVPDEYITSIRDYMGKNLGVSGTRFDDLMFSVVESRAEKGDTAAIELLKRPRPDGTPGLYDDPEWRTKIDNLEFTAQTRGEARAQKDRDSRQNEALYSVFSEEDPKKAQAMFKDLKQANLFTRADDLIKWERLMLEKVDGKPDINQLDKEGALLKSVYEGKLGYRELLAEQSSGAITASQRKYLMNEVRRVQTENRQASAAEGKAQDAIYKTRDFQAAEDFLKGVLRPRPAGIQDYMGVGTEFDRAQLATASLEFTKAARGRAPEELDALASEIAKKYIERRKWSQDPEKNAAVVSLQNPFKSLQAIRDALAAGQINPTEARTYHQLLKGNP
jgi:hypothetical protein